MVTVPLKDGKELKIPASNLIYDPAHHQLNISEEMSRTGIWRQLNSESSLLQQGIGAESGAGSDAGPSKGRRSSGQARKRFG